MPAAGAQEIPGANWASTPFILKGMFAQICGQGSCWATYGSLLASLARDRSKAEAVLACRQRPERSGQILLPLSLAISRQGIATECNSVLADLFREPGVCVQCCRSPAAWCVMGYCCDVMPCQAKWAMWRSTRTCDLPARWASTSRPLACNRCGS